MRSKDQKGTMQLVIRKSGQQVWVYRWSEPDQKGNPKRIKKVMGPLARFPTEDEVWAEVERLGLGRSFDEFGPRNFKELVDHLATAEPPLSAATIQGYLQIVKAVVASVVGDDGQELFPRKWNHAYIDAPAVKNQRQPTIDCSGISDIILFATGQYRMLYALLAGCGPLRIGEALGLEIDKHISPDFRTLAIRQNVKRRKIHDHLKTAAGEREVDLCSTLSSMLRDFVGFRRSGLLFHNRLGNPLDQAHLVTDYLQPILDYLAQPHGGFHLFRRFRRTYIERFECPEALKHFWSGHAQTHVSERYIKLTQDRDFRLMWAEKIGLGFDLPGERNGQLGQLLQFPKAV